VSGVDGSEGPERQQGLASAIAAVSERATLLIHEEIELAKTEIAEKATRLAKGMAVGLVAGLFFATALFFVLIGLAWLLYFELPIGNQFTYFWGFFAMALILVVLGVIAGIVAAKAVKSGAPPVPAMAIAEARKIRETVSGGSRASSEGDGLVSPAGSPPSATPPLPVMGWPASAEPDASSQTTQDFPAFPVEPPSEGSREPNESPEGYESQESHLGRETGDGPTLGS
jgi:Putative Actinobacterial Holin-X, holin superfamily III